eukprot:scaffold88623_cov36-Phaeocystis_antarctica.AAC.1
MDALGLGLDLSLGPGPALGVGSGEREACGARGRVSGSRAFTSTKSTRNRKAARKHVGHAWMG